MSEIAYGNTLSREPRLTVEEEIECGRAIQKMMPLLGKDDLTPDERRIIRRGERAKERMIKGNLLLVAHVARRCTFLVRNMEFVDLCQEGIIGLTRAAEKFDPTKGYKFSTYAYWWIRQGINRAISDCERTIRIPSNMVEQLARVDKYVQQHKDEGLGVPTIAECSKALKMSESVLRAALVVRQGVLSLDATITSTDDEVSLMSAIQDDRNRDMYTNIMNNDRLATLDACEHLLSEENHMLVGRYFGVFGYASKCSYRELSLEMGVSREAIRQRIERALKGIRLKLAPYEAA